MKVYVVVSNYVNLFVTLHLDIALSWVENCEDECSIEEHNLDEVGRSYANN